MDFQIVHRVELAAKEIIKQHGDIVGRLGIDENESRRQVCATTCGEKERAFERPCSSIRDLHCHREVQLVENSTV